MGELERYGVPQPAEQTPHASVAKTSEPTCAPSGVPQCTQPCKQLVALFNSVERLEEVVFRLQKEVAGMEILLTGLEARR